MKKGFNILSGLIASMLMLASTRVVAQSAREYEVKAAFLFNIIQFVEWPPVAFENVNAPIRIGVFGANPFGRALEDTVRNETVKGRKVVVERIRQPEELKSCQLVFVAKSDKGRINEVLSATQSAAILTVSEVEGFIQSGGLINFFMEGNKVRFEINPTAAQRQGLKISSELLILGKIVGSQNSEREK